MKTATTTMPRAETRTFMWTMLPLPVRRVVMWFAGMPDDRAGDELAAFSVRERARIRGALQSMMMNLDIAEQCMNDSDITTRITREMVLH